MATEDIIVLAAAPAIAYREYLYRPDGPFARWISDRFDVVGRPGQPVDRPPRPGDVLLEVTLGRPARAGASRSRPVTRRSWRRPPSLAPGQLLLRPLKRVEMSEPLPVEPTPGDPGVPGPRAQREQAGRRIRRRRIRSRPGGARRTWPPGS